MLQKSKTCNRGDYLKVLQNLIAKLQKVAKRIFNRGRS